MRWNPEEALQILESKKSLFHILGKFVLACGRKGLAQKSIQNYIEFVSPFFLNSSIEKIEDINLATINSYSIELFLTERQLSKQSISTYLRHIKVFLRWCEKEYNIKKISDRIELPRLKKKNVHLYEAEEIRMIYDIARNGTTIDWINDRNCCLISLMLDSGLRRHELTLVKPQDWRKDYHLLLVHGKGEKDRTVPIGKLTRYFIGRYLQRVPEVKSQDYFFLERDRKSTITDNAVKLLVNRMAKQLPFEFSAHKLRHNFATNYCLDQYEEHGQIDIYRLKVLLGHSDLKTTEMYLHIANEIIASQTHISHLDKVFYAVT